MIAYILKTNGIKKMRPFYSLSQEFTDDKKMEAVESQDCLNPDETWC